MSDSQSLTIDTGSTTDEFELVLTAPQVQDLRDWTLQEDDVERFAYIYCERSGDRLLAREIDPIPAEDCAVMEASAVRPDLSIERDRLGTAMADGLVPIMVHSHPFSQHPGFSTLDDDIMESYRNWIGQLFPEIPLGFVVVGQEGVDTAIYTDPSKPQRDKLPVTVIGDWLLETPLSAPRSDDKQSIDRDRYDRSIRALTDNGQKRVASTRVGIVGLGGLGSMVAVQLARFGVQDFVFADPDIVERSNLPRIYGATDSDIDRKKVDVVGEQVVSANPKATIEAYPTTVQEVPDSELSDCDVIIGTVDRLEARLYCNEFAIRNLRYYIDGGVSIETDDSGRVTDERGLIQLVAPGANACLDCLGRNDAEHLRVEEMSDDEIQADIQRGYLEGDVNSPEPAITPLNGQAASTITRQFTKLVTRYSAPADFIRFDGLNDDLVAVGTHPSDECLCCGADAELASGERSYDREELIGGEGDLDIEFSDPMETPSDESADPRTLDRSTLPQESAETAASAQTTSPGNAETSEVNPAVEASPASQHEAWGREKEPTADASTHTPSDRAESATRSPAEGQQSASRRLVRKQIGPIVLLFLAVLALRKLRERL